MQNTSLKHKEGSIVIRLLEKVGGSSLLEPTERGRRILVVFFLLGMMFIMLSFSIYHFYSQHYSIFVWNGLGFFISLFILLYIRKKGKTAVIDWMVGSGVILYCSMTTIFGRTESSIFYWAFILPIVCFAVTGKNKGLVLSLLFLCINVFLMAAPEQMMHSQPYPFSSIMRFGIIYISITLGTYYYESLQKILVTDIQQHEEKYRNILENMQEGYFEINLAGNYIYFNDSLCRVHGYPREELMGMSYRQYTDQVTAEKLFQAFNRVYKTGKPLPEIDFQITTKDGNKRCIDASISLLEDSSGKPIGFRGVIRDITERKQGEELQRTFDSLRKAVGATVQVLVSALEFRDPYTAGHQSRVADLARAIAEEMGLPQSTIEGTHMAGVVHDIGKLSIPTEILTKPTRLTNIEFSLIQEHANSGYEMLKNVESPWPLAEIVLQHHERMNGSGYPRKLKGDEILLEARIMAVADVVEAMASHRPYRPALGIEAALEEIEKNKGLLYDDVVSDICLKLFREKGYQLT
ncbi:MAG: PAS domain S-box protein [Syntrophaceae bacterium]|nr:PAS domain S-box protein [Syntrophaceae bacterium]